MSVVSIVMIFTIILLSMTIHEAMHAFMGYFLGDNTAKIEGRLTLNPLKHIDPFMTILLPLIMALLGGPVFGGAKPVPFNPNRVRYGEWGAAMVALAGPLTNLFIAFLAFGIGALMGVVSNGGLVTSSFLGSVIAMTVSVNLGFFVFNMLPVPPLDGSRLLYALAPESARRLMEQIEQYGTLVVFLLVVLFSSAIGRVMNACISTILDVFMMIFSV
ncbi:site-2 protease family protein [TM7 phylum sp. oral taxon 353]|nr:site-2 protease family protein [TM7 phylum sp. oral taxon 353]